MTQVGHITTEQTNLEQEPKTDWSRVGRKSRRKGKSHEREIARVLRKSTSCEWLTTRNSGRTDLGGDVYSPGGMCDNVMFECKHRKSWKMSDMVLGNSEYVHELTKVLCDWGARPEYVALVVIIKNDVGMWVMATARDKQCFAAQRPAVLLRCAARWIWNYAGKGEDNQAQSPVIRELFRWLVRVGPVGQGE